MNQRLYVILTGEQVQSRSFSVAKSAVIAVVCVFLALLGMLFSMSIAGLDFLFENRNLRRLMSNQEEELHAVKLANDFLQKQVAKVDEEKKALLADAVDKLNEKNRLMESVLSSVGVDVDVKESQQSMGGPFIGFAEETLDDLIFKADRYLEMIRYIPLGAPVPGVITSKFGRRRDPINSKSAFHNGVDIKAKMGTEVKATADGKVFKRGYDKGLGRSIILDHTNGFTTKFGHLKKIIVTKGEKVGRGQTIGLLGNSGRSTGPHLHYEITYQKKFMDPAKYMKIAKYISFDNGK